MNSNNTGWYIFEGNNTPDPAKIERLKPPPPWRAYSHKDAPQTERELAPEDDERGQHYVAGREGIELVNAALYLRRPLLITGKPGTGKSTLAAAVAYELGLGRVLRWSITTRTTLQDGLYRYDAIGRLQEASLARDKASRVDPADIGQFLRLGPLGTALLPSKRPRVLLVDEIDKSDIDLPNDLLNIFEEGEFEITELTRLSGKGAGESEAGATNSVEILPYDAKDEGDRVAITNGRVRCAAFPLVIMTSNGEREFPPAFLRRCLRLHMAPPDKARLQEIVEARLRQHLGENYPQDADEIIGEFYEKSQKSDLATDQLLNAIYLRGLQVPVNSGESLEKSLLKPLNSADNE